MAAIVDELPKYLFALDVIALLHYLLRCGILARASARPQALTKGDLLLRQQYPFMQLDTGLSILFVFMYENSLLRAGKQDLS